MFNDKRGRGVWWVCAAAVVLLATGCVPVASEESGGNAPASDGSGVGGENGSVGSAGSGSVTSSSTAATVPSPTSAVSPSTFTTSSEEEFDRPDFSDYSDAYIAALAFHLRTLVDNDPFAIDSNDRSTPLGAFCWVVWSVGVALSSFEASLFEDLFLGSRYQILRLWHAEQEAAERGIQWTWDKGPVSYNYSLESVLREALAPQVRETVFSPGLPHVLKPWAEDLYVLLEEWSAFPVVNRPRPLLEALLSLDEGTSYRGFEGVTAEELAGFWPAETEVMLGPEAFDDFKALLRDMDSEEVRSVMDSACKIRAFGGLIENACPPWVTELLDRTDCGWVPEDEPRWGRFADLYEWLQETDIAAQMREENGGGGEEEVSSGAVPPELVDGVIPAEVGISEEGLERLWRVLGADKFAAVLAIAEWLAEPEEFGWDIGVLLGRLAGEDGFLTEEELGRLAERRSGETLARAANTYSEEELAEYANEDEERMVGPGWPTDVSDFEGRFADVYSDEEVKGLAFYKRVQAELENRFWEGNNRFWGVDDFFWEGNNRFTPVGAFCGAVLRVRHIASLTGTGIGSGFRPWRSRNLEVWHLDREAEERGIELEWETPPLDADRTLRSVLGKATSSRVRSVVFDPGLPSVLRPAAEALYSVYDELRTLPVRRVRPRVEELSEYRRLKDLTEQEIVQIWPAMFELDYREEDYTKYWNAMKVLQDDAVREFINAKCKELPVENTCPPWEVQEETDSWLGVLCSNKFEGFESLIETCLPFFLEDIGLDESRLDILWLYVFLSDCIAIAEVDTTDEVRISEEGLERLRRMDEGWERLKRVLGEDKFAAMLGKAGSLADSALLEVDSRVLLDRLAGKNGFLTEEGLGKLAERGSGEELALLALIYSEEELAEYANEGEERMVWLLDTDVSDIERFADVDSYDEVKGWALYERVQAELENRFWEGNYLVWEGNVEMEGLYIRGEGLYVVGDGNYVVGDGNDLSTPVGAFCWAVLRVGHIESRTLTGITGGFRPWRSRNLRVWYLEREARKAEEWGLELEWETPPLDADHTLRRVLLEATDPAVRSVVFDLGLPSVLRPAAEALYSVYDELLALPVRRVRPTVEELSAYDSLKDFTEQEIAQIWPEEFELDYSEADRAKYWNAMDMLVMVMLRDDEVREFLNDECKELPVDNPCQPWEVPETAVGWLGVMCSDKFRGFESLMESCLLFFKEGVGLDESGLDALLLYYLFSGCPVLEWVFEGVAIPDEVWISEEGLERLRRVLEEDGEDKDGEIADAIIDAIAEAALERLRRVLGEDKLAAVLEAVESLAWESYGPDSEPDSGVLLGRVLLGKLAGEHAFLTEEELGKLAERRSGETLARAANTYSEEELAEYANEDEERMVEPWYAGLFVEGRFADEYSDEEVKGQAFYMRADVERYNRLWEGNDLSTPVGAFCWAVFRVIHSDDWGITEIGGGFRHWGSFSLWVWHLEREAEERGIELEWETPPLDTGALGTLRRVLLEVTAPEVRSVVFDPGLPSVLRPAAEALYSVYDELLTLSFRRVRPRVEELSEYRRLQGLTEEEVAQIWPEEFELDYRDEDYAKYLNAMGMLRDDEVRGLLNAECKKRPSESPCPPWELPETAAGFNAMCNSIEDKLEEFSSYSCPIFFKGDITFYMEDMDEVMRRGLLWECSS